MYVCTIQSILIKNRVIIPKHFLVIVGPLNEKGDYFWLYFFQIYLSLMETEMILTVR